MVNLLTTLKEQTEGTNGLTLIIIPAGNARVPTRKLKAIQAETMTGDHVSYEAGPRDEVRQLKKVSAVFDCLCWQV